MLALTYWLAVTADRTPARVSIATAASTDCQVRHGVVFILLLLADRADAVEDDFDVSRTDPLLENKAGFEITRRRSTL